MVAPGTCRLGGQQTYRDEAVMPPLCCGSSRAHLFGRGQHVRFGLAGYPVGHADVLFGQQRPSGAFPQ